MNTIRQQVSAKALKRLLAQEKQQTLPVDLFDVEDSVDEQQRGSASVRLKRGFYLLKGEGVER